MTQRSSPRWKPSYVPRRFRWYRRGRSISIRQFTSTPLAGRAYRSACGARSSAYATSPVWETSRTRTRISRMSLWQIVLVVGLGIAYGFIQPGRFAFALGHATLYVFLPALLFEAAWNLNYKAVARNWTAIAMLAGP